MKLSKLVQEHNLQCSAPHICPDGLAQYVGNGNLWTTVITQNDSIIKILDDRYNLSLLLA